MLFYRGRQRILDANGNPVPGALANFYLTTTGTRTDTYSDAALTIPLANPVPADAYGFLPPIYLDPAVTYKCVITTAAGVSLPDGTVDPVIQVALDQQAIGAILYPRSDAERTALITPTNYYIPSHLLDGEVNPYRYAAVGDGIADDIIPLRNAFKIAKAIGGVVKLDPHATYYVSDGFGTTSTVTDFADNVTIDGQGATIKVNAAAWPIGATPVIRLEGNNVCVRRIKFTSTVTFDNLNTDPTTYRTRNIIGVLIGGKAASYFAVADSLTYYKKRATVEWCDFTSIHSPIIATQSSVVRVLNNYCYNYNASCIVTWGCPQDILIDGNHTELGSDDGIIVSMQNAAKSAWVTAGNYAGGVRIVNNYAGYSRARPISTGGLSDVIIANNNCEMSLQAGIGIFGDSTLFATGASYNKNITIDSNTIVNAGRFYDVTSGFAYWTGPVAQNNVGIGTQNYSGTRGSSVLPRNIKICNNTIVNPSGSAHYLYALDLVFVEGNTCVTGTKTQGAATVNTNGSAFTSIDCTSVLIDGNRVFPGDGVAWNYTYTIASTSLSTGDVVVGKNFVIGTESYDAGNENPLGLKINAQYYTFNFQPAVAGSGTAGAGTYTTRVGQATKIGNRIFFNINLIWTAHTGVGSLLITNMPYVSDSTTGSSSTFSIFNTDIAMTAGKVMQCSLINNTNVMGIYQTPTGGGTSADVPIDTAGQITISGHYPVPN